MSCITIFAVAAIFMLVVDGKSAENGLQSLKVSKQPLHSGRISPNLFGNFMELLDDLVPGMWAEMLNDRSFEGVTKSANWCYYDGDPILCDREWDKNDTWDYDSTNPFNGSRSVRFNPSEWKKYTVRITSNGTTGSAVFELKANGSVWTDKLSLMPADRT